MRRGWCARECVNRNTRRYDRRYRVAHLTPTRVAFSRCTDRFSMSTGSPLKHILDSVSVPVPAPREPAAPEPTRGSLWGLREGILAHVNMMDAVFWEHIARAALTEDEQATYTALAPRLAGEASSLTDDERANLLATRATLECKMAAKAREEANEKRFASLVQLALRFVRESVCPIEEHNAMAARARAAAAPVTVPPPSPPSTPAPITHASGGSYM